MFGYTEIDGINFSNSFICFLEQWDNSYNHINIKFKNILLENYLYGYLSREDYYKILKDVNKIDIFDDGYILFNDNRKIKFGKFVLKFLKKTHNEESFKKEVMPYIENYVDVYKSWYKINSTLKFKHLKGKDILNGYNIEKYQNNFLENMLSNSCMNNKYKYLDIYVKNPDKINLLVLIDGNNKIYGRSLIWKLDNKPYLFMDRIYGVDNYINNMFIDYAKKNNMAYRSNKHTKNFKIYLPNEKPLYSRKIKFEVKLNVKGIYNYPYIDSMFNWNKLTNEFSNKSNFIPFFREKLRHLDGYFEPGIKIFGKRINF